MKQPYLNKKKAKNPMIFKNKKTKKIALPHSPSRTRALLVAMIFATIGCWYLLLTQAAAAPTVKFVLFCASDQCSGSTTELSQYATEIQNWYKARTGKTFTIQRVQLYRSNKKASYFNSNGSYSTNNAFFRIEAEPGIAESNVITVAMLGFRAMNNCGTGSNSVSLPNAGLAVSDPFRDCGNIKSAVLAHELGHNLLNTNDGSLDHTTDGTLMHAPLACNNRPLSNCSLNQSQAAAIAKTPWFNPGTVAPTSYDNASCTTGTTAPNSLVGGQSFTAKVYMYNAGTTTWNLGNTSGTWRLGSSNPRDNARWGINRVDSSGTVAPGGTAVFTINAKAPSPSATTSYAFDWEMVKEGSYWLKDQPQNPARQPQYPVCAKTISVSPSSTTTASTCTRHINFNLLGSPSSPPADAYVQSTYPTSGTVRKRDYYYKYTGAGTFYNHQIDSVTPTPPSGSYAHKDINGVHGIDFNYVPYFQAHPGTSYQPTIYYHYIYAFSGPAYVNGVYTNLYVRQYDANGNLYAEGYSIGDGSGPVTDQLRSTGYKNTSIGVVSGPNLSPTCN